MPKVIFIEHNGTEHVIEAQAGASLMQVATANFVPGVLGDCGGGCSCATCHAYIGEPFASKVAPRSELESMTVECAIEPREESRLICQITMTDELDGIRVQLPVSQF